MFHAAIPLRGIVDLLAFQAGDVQLAALVDGNAEDRRVCRTGPSMRQALVDRLEQFQPADAPFDVADQVLSDLVGGLELGGGLLASRS